MFALPRYSNPRFLSTAEDRKDFKRAFRVFLGQSWEELVRETLRQRPLPGSDILWRNVARWWGNAINRRAMEIDVVAESADGKTLLVGKTKLALSEVEARHTLAELKVKAELLPFASRYERVETRLFVAEGGIPDCIDLSWLE